MKKWIMFSLLAQQALVLGMDNGHGVGFLTGYDQQSIGFPVPQNLGAIVGSDQSNNTSLQGYKKNKKDISELQDVSQEELAAIDARMHTYRCQLCSSDFTGKELDKLNTKLKNHFKKQHPEKSFSYSITPPSEDIYLICKCGYQTRGYFTKSDAWVLISAHCRNIKKSNNNSKAFIQMHEDISSIEDVKIMQFKNSINRGTEQSLITADTSTTNRINAIAVSVDIPGLQDVSQNELAAIDARLHTYTCEVCFRSFKNKTLDGLKKSLKQHFIEQHPRKSFFYSATPPSEDIYLICQCGYQTRGYFTKSDAWILISGHCRNIVKLNNSKKFIQMHENILSIEDVRLMRSVDNGHKGTDQPLMTANTKTINALNSIAVPVEIPGLQEVSQEELALIDARVHTYQCHECPSIFKCNTLDELSRMLKQHFKMQHPATSFTYNITPPSEDIYLICKCGYKAGGYFTKSDAFPLMSAHCRNVMNSNKSENIIQMHKNLLIQDLRIMRSVDNGNRGTEQPLRTANRLHEVSQEELAVIDARRHIYACQLCSALFSHESLDSLKINLKDHYVNKHAGINFSGNITSPCEDLYLICECGYKTEGYFTKSDALKAIFGHCKNVINSEETKKFIKKHQNISIQNLRLMRSVDNGNKGTGQPIIATCTSTTVQPQITTEITTYTSSQNGYSIPDSLALDVNNLNANRNAMGDLDVYPNEHQSAYFEHAGLLDYGRIFDMQDVPFQALETIEHDQTQLAALVATSNNNKRKRE